MLMRGLLLATVFLAGGSLMSLEMASFRLIQPEFGSDIIVWGSLISVFLGGLSVGAFAGGRFADRAPRLWKLGAILAAAGVLTLLLPLPLLPGDSPGGERESIADRVLDRLFPGAGAPLPAEWNETGAGGLVIYQPPDLRWPTLAVGAILFGLPALLLGTVTPYTARLFIHSLGRVGTGVGKVSGVSTVGSIAGTLGTAFYLVTWMGTRWLLVSNGLLLLGLGAVLAVAGAVVRDHPPDAA
ncbi:MAG: fused MFS/spermidine synthase [Planctomycetes bacterium]|nr:fused MFS/spermidine synthase [Planctomycetota bacterium]